MRTNGTIRLKIKVGGGIDPETGYPTKPTIDWSDDIPCLFNANKYNNFGKVDGMTFTSASYDILIENQPVESEVLVLFDKNGKDLGEFAIMEVSDEAMKGRTRIIV